MIPGRSFSRVDKSIKASHFLFVFFFPFGKMKLRGLLSQYEGRKERETENGKKEKGKGWKHPLSDDGMTTKWRD